MAVFGSAVRTTATLRCVRAVKLVAATLIPFTILYGCAVGTTPYQPEGIIGGYGEHRIDDKTWQVYSRGNGLTYFETAETYWFHRSAELALSKGFDGFSIVSTYELTDGHYAPNVEGTIVLLKYPFVPVPGKVFDARFVEAALRDTVNGKKCASDRVCQKDWHELMTTEIFLRMTVFNLAGQNVGLSFGDAIHELRPGYAAIAVEYPQEPQHWLLKITSGNCTYDYEMPHDLDDRPWRALGYGNTEIMMQLAPDFSLHVVPPHLGPRVTESTVLTTKDLRPPIVPKKICQ